MNRCQKHGMCDSWGKEWGDKKKHFQAEFKGKKCHLSYWQILTQTVREGRAAPVLSCGW